MIIITYRDSENPTNWNEEHWFSLTLVRTVYNYGHLQLIDLRISLHWFKSCRYGNNCFKKMTDSFCGYDIMRHQTLTIVILASKIPIAANCYSKIFYSNRRYAYKITLSYHYGIKSVKNHSCLLHFVFNVCIIHCHKYSDINRLPSLTWWNCISSRFSLKSSLYEIILHKNPIDALLPSKLP